MQMLLKVIERTESNEELFAQIAATI